MWSKHQGTNAADVKNNKKNATTSKTSSKNNATSAKNKSSATTTNTTTTTTTAQTTTQSRKQRKNNNKSNKSQQQQQQQTVLSKNPKDNKQQNVVVTDNEAGEQPSNTVGNCNLDLIKDHCDPVVLRKKSTNNINPDENLIAKRYSDSLLNPPVNENKNADGGGTTINKNDTTGKLTRTRSGFFDSSSTNNNNFDFGKEPQNSSIKRRRFSDLFSRTASFVAAKHEMTGGDNNDKNSEHRKSADVVNNSVLQRVRSRICKGKSSELMMMGSSSLLLPSMPDINENKEQTTTNSYPRPMLDYRLQRQRSNLEFSTRIPTKLLASNKTVVGASKVVQEETNKGKPNLAKAKSSSAINISLLRSRRKLLEYKNKYCSSKTVDDEFEYIACDGSNYKNDKVALLNRTFGSKEAVVDNNSENTKRFSAGFLITTNNNNNDIDFGGDDECDSGPNNRQQHQRRSSWVPGAPPFIDADNNGSKSGNQLTRTPSDKRPDALKEESSRNAGGQQDHHHHHSHSSATHSQSFNEGGENDGSKCETSTSLPTTASGGGGGGGNKRRQHSNINRSESVKEQSEKNRKQKRNVSDPLRSTNETLDLESQSTFKQHSGSSSNSSLSSRSSEYQNSNNLDPVLDSDLDIDSYPSDWTAGLSEEQLAQIDATEKQRQDVVNELFHTERSHVRNLKVMDLIFRKSLIESKLLTDQELNLVFANLTELLSIHNQYNAAMKSKRKDNPVVSGVGDLLLEMFDGEKGTEFCEAAANFCKRQHQALEFLSKRKKDSKFEAVLIGCEKHTLCRRLPLQGFLPQEMQRLSKYPLLIERLITAEEKADRTSNNVVQGDNTTDGTTSELEKLRSALEKSKEILNRVNEVAKIEYNRNRLEEIKNHLDVVPPSRADVSMPAYNELKNIDLTNYTLVHEGTVTLKRREPKNPISVQLLLLEESVILLHKEGERFTLKYFNQGNHQSFFPLIKLSNLICRKNAAELRTLFLVNTSQQSPTKFEIQCRDVCERRTWYKYLTEATEPYKKDVKTKQRIEKNNREHLEEETIHDLSSNGNINNSRVEEQQNNESNEPSNLVGDSGGKKVADDEVLSDDKVSSSHSTIPKDETAPSIPGDGLSIKLAANDWPLIQPSEVHVSDTLAHSAESCLTPLEKIRRKDDEVKKALADKEVLVADLLSIPRDDYHLIADIASNESLKESLEGEPSELVLAAVYQVDQLMAAVNDSLNISETDAVLATGAKIAACNSNEHHFTKQTNVPSVPVAKLQQIATNLTSQLTILLSLSKQREEERNKLRKEVQRLRELNHEKHNLHHNKSNNNVNEDSVLSGDLESIEESPKETETA